MGAAAAMSSQWQSFDKQWEAVLEREQLPYIHYVDLVGRRKFYRKYSTPEANRIDAELTSIALSTIPLTVSAVLRLDDYQSIYNVDATRRFNRNSPLGILSERPPRSFRPISPTQVSIIGRNWISSMKMVRTIPATSRNSISY